MVDEGRTNEIWILGGAGRIGGDLARRLTDLGIGELVLVDRDEERLIAVADGIAAAVRMVAVDDVQQMAAMIRAERPGVVVNLLGSFAQNAPILARACMPGGRYVDLASDLISIAAIHDLDEEATAAGSTLVTGAGFGVVGVEAPLVALCQGREAPARVQVAALGSFAAQDGVVGEAFAVTSVDVIATGGRCYRDGQLVPSRLGSRMTRHELPDGTSVTSAAVPSGELFVAQRVSGAPDVDFTSALAPTGPMVRAVLPLVSRLMRRSSVRRWLTARMAEAKTKAAPRPREYSWGHVVVEWSDGTRREGWLRAGDAMEFTAASIAAVVAAATGSQVPPGASTPAALFGPEIAADAGAALFL